VSPAHPTNQRSLPVINGTLDSRYRIFPASSDLVPTDPSIQGSPSPIPQFSLDSFPSSAVPSTVAPTALAPPSPSSVAVSVVPQILALALLAVPSIDVLRLLVSRQALLGLARILRELFVVHRYRCLL